MDELTSAEVLHAALEALRRGARFEDVAAGLPDDVLRMLETSRRLERAGSGPVGMEPGPGSRQGRSDGSGHGQAQGPSATFTLALEEQLRTDFRLRARAGTGGAWPRWRGAILIAGVLAVVGAIGLAGKDFGPYGVLSAGGAARSGDVALERLDDGWREIEALRSALDRGAPDDASTRRRLDRITTAFLEALDSVAVSGDARARARVGADVTTAAGALASMARSVDDRTAEEIISAQRQLVVRLLRTRVGSLDPDPVEVPGTIEVPRTIVSTPLASPSASAEPTRVSGDPTSDPAPTTPTARAIVSPTPTPTRLPPLMTAVPSPTATSEPIEPAPPATSRPRPTDPPPPAPPEPTEVPAPIVPPTRTPDAWPTSAPTEAPPVPPVATPPGEEPSPPPPSPPAIPPTLSDPGAAANATERP